MGRILTKNAGHIQDELEKRGLPCRVVELSSSTRTAMDAATSLGCDVSQIVKSLIFKTKETGRPVLVLASGAHQVSEKGIESHVGEGIIKADAGFVREITGFAIGGVPPLGHKTPINFIFMDQELLNFEEVWAAAGTPHGVFSIRSKELQFATKAKVISIG